MSARPIDADDHYDEPLDAFTRHLDPAFKRRGVLPVRDGKRVELLIGGRLNSFVPNPTFDPIIVPGCLDRLFRGKIPDGVSTATLLRTEPLRAEYRDRDARLAVANAQGPEEVLRALADLIGVERILFGSDWPHGEGVAQPLDFAKELSAFDERETRRILRENCLELLGA